MSDSYVYKCEFTFVYLCFIKKRIVIDNYKHLIEHRDKADLFHRYITNKNIEPLLKTLPSHFMVTVIGRSVLDKPIYEVEVGTGKIKLLLWSQMHGNESTTTKAIFDLFLFLSTTSTVAKHILENCTIKVIPILNPDGAQNYTRCNANGVDLNRDAQKLSQPESLILRNVFDSFKPNYCLNLHGQRTIFGIGQSNKSSVLSFLSPATDSKRSITKPRMIAMDIIAHIVKGLNYDLKGNIGRYDDSFNINCVGDTFQNQGVPTILFEAGHYRNDYPREITRKYVFGALIIALDYISNYHPIAGKNYEAYFDIEENQKSFFDIIIRNAVIDGNSVDIAIQYKEQLTNGMVEFVPRIEQISKLENYYAHKEIDAQHNEVLGANSSMLCIGHENDFVFIKNEKISLTQ